MRKLKMWMSAAILICGTTIVLTSCSDNDNDEDQTPPASEETTKAPDYSDKNNWLRQPEPTKDVDVFYVYPTEYADDSEGASMFADINDKSLRQEWENVYQMQATAYEESANVFAPYYRQLNMASAASLPSEELNAAFASTPKEDVIAAIDYYFKNLNNGRPFILASHSQGSIMQRFVLAEYMKEHPEYQKRMIAAYVIGYSITEDYLKANPHLKFAEGADDTGVIISYNTEGPGNENNLVVLPGAISINPINWKRDETYASAEENLGGYILNEKLAKMEYVPNAADAKIDLKRGVIITTTKTLEPMPGPKPFGNASYHNGDYALYYYNIKANVATRIAAYQKASQKADLVVYGKIFTAEDNQVAEAFVVKDGKFVYVGDKAGAEAYVEDGKTEVVDYSGKGLVMPGCGNGHAHYSMGYAIKSVGTTFGIDVTVEQFFKDIVPAAVKKAKDTGATSVFGQGWNAMTFSRIIDYRRQMDAICSDLPIFLGDEEGHKALVNTNLLVKAGIMSADGTVLISEIRGGEIVMGTDGTPTGYLSEQACKYVRSFMDNESLYTIDIAKANLASCQEQLLAEGYTMYLDGYSSYFFNDHFYKAAQQMDQAGELHLLLGAAWEMESWMDVDDNLAKARDTQKYASKHIFPRWLKMFMDGTVESGTGYIEPLYLDGHQGIPNWTEEELTDISRKANEKGITMHVHVMGNKGVECLVNAFINGGKDEMRNTLIHVYYVNESDYQRIADHNIYVSEGLLWHHASNEELEAAPQVLPENLAGKCYPMKSFFDYGINISSHSDYPALAGAPDDPFGIMEIAVTGVMVGENGNPVWPEELITREQALQALTINVAKQMFIEDERGSIKEGKYADFLLVTKDVLSCPVTEIHTAKPAATYFEGKKVWSHR